MKSLVNNKNIGVFFALLLIVVMFSSCNRGGYGCPYELEAAANLLSAVAK